MRQRRRIRHVIHRHKLNVLIINRRAHNVAPDPPKPVDPHLGRHSFLRSKLFASPTSPANETFAAPHHTPKFPAPPNPKCYGLHPQKSTQAPFGVRRLDAAFPPDRRQETPAMAILQSHPVSYPPSHAK